MESNSSARRRFLKSTFAIAGLAAGEQSATGQTPRAFLITPATLAQRIVRAKAVIRAKAIPYRVPVSKEFGAYSVQAAIAAVHAESCSAASTDWRQITLHYDRLLRIQQPRLSN